MLKNILVMMAITGCVELKAQTKIGADSIYLATYNTGAQFQLKRAPFGEMKPKLDVVKPMVFAEDSIEVKKDDKAKKGQIQIPTIAFVRTKLSEHDLKGATPQRPTQSDVEKVKSNEGKRTCNINTTNLKGNMVLLDFDKGCDPTFKCLQAQRAGAISVIVISDNDKKDSIALIKGKFADSLRIPCFSITRSQGDSLRMILPTQATLYKPVVRYSSLERSAILEFNAYKLDRKAVLQWQNNTQPDVDYFVIERSADGVNFEYWQKMGVKDTLRSLQTYTLDDTEPLEDDNFYRLIVKRKDGTNIRTETKYLSFPALKDFDFYPNPATDEVTINLKQFEKKSFDLMLYDASGKEIYKEHLDNISTPIKKLNLSRLNLSEGYYSITVLNKGRAYTRRFIFAR
jgi:Secretion system C-terminal sorting domain/PA domain